MSGNKYLLDTNFILGILKSDPLVLAQVSSRQLHVGECSYSAITRMELLGFHNITREEELLTCSAHRSTPLQEEYTLCKL